MDIDKLIERLNTKLQSYASYTDSEFARAMEDAITAIETLRADLARVTAERDAAIEKVKRALAMMWFAYVNSDKEFPHNYETEALEEAERILGPWAECMPKYLRRGILKED